MQCALKSQLTWLPLPFNRLRFKVKKRLFCRVVQRVEPLVKGHNGGKEQRTVNLIMLHALLIDMLTGTDTLGIFPGKCLWCLYLIE